ncbi:MAG: hypothetical protein ACLRXQ_05250 [Phascolarctobacterium faecium]
MALALILLRPVKLLHGDDPGLFGATNQLVAAIALLMGVWVIRSLKKRRIHYVPVAHAGNYYCGFGTDDCR